MRVTGLIGRKLGMARVFGEGGQAIPVTVIEAGPCSVVQLKGSGEAPEAVQLGFGRRKAKRTPKAMAGHAAGAALDHAPAVLRDLPLSTEGDRPKPGDVVTVEMFQPGDLVKVVGTTKGRGFQGVVKRHGFRGGPASHGNTRHRKPGSIGPGTDPSRVIKGKKLPGQYGGTRHTELGLAVVRVDAERNLLLVRGAVPGPRNGVVLVTKQAGRSRYA